MVKDAMLSVDEQHSDVIYDVYTQTERRTGMCD